jgi:hypothetical protein
MVMLGSDLTAPSQVSSLHLSLEATLKQMLCPKKNVEHLNRTVHSPNCMSYCSDLCGKYCQDKCNRSHTGDCQRGQLPDNYGYCPSIESRSDGVILSYTSFEKREVDLGKGKPFTRVEQILSPMGIEEYTQKWKVQFSEYGEHTLTYWFLRATKIEAFAPAQARMGVVTSTSDFGEAIVCIDKREVSDSFYHRREV